MIKQLQYFGKTDQGIFARSLFGSAGVFEKVAGAPPFADLETGDELRKTISSISKQDRTKFCYVLVNALGAGEFYGCFPAGAIVRARRGDLPIEQIVVGDEVLTHENRWRKVTSLHPKHHERGLTHLKVAGVPYLTPTLSGTPNHEVRVILRDDLIRARRKILYKRESRDWESAYGEFVSSLEADWLAMEFIRPGDFLLQPFPVEIRDSEFSQKWGNQDFAYLFGLFAAEGCLAERYDKDRNKPLSRADCVEKIVYVIGGHEEHIVQRVQQIGAKYGRIVQIRRDPDTHSVRLELGWKELANACFEHIGCHSTEKSLSWDILTMPHSWQEAFLAPYVEGDGHVVCGSKWERYNGSVVISTASKNLALDIRLLYARLGVVASVGGRHNTKATWYNGNPIYAIHIGKTFSEEWDGTPKASSYIDSDRGFLISPVKEVFHEKWSGEVFDLTVEEDSSYVVNGVVVHNSNINSDFFPWNALAHEGDDYGYKTFLKAHAFSHHKNKDPERAFGIPIASLLNPRMKRVELIIKLDREKAKLEDADGIINRIDAGEFPDCSMGCKVPFDICSICGNHSKTKDDYCACMRPGPEDKDALGPNKILPDGRRVCVINTLPRFFDISFVFIGADKTAKVMAKLAYVHDCWVPTGSVILSADAGFQFYKGMEMQKVAFKNDDIISGGLADKKSVSDFDPKALKKGIKVEMEHSNSKALAKEIASDHLTEDSKYYDKLQKMEKQGAHKKLSEILKDIPAGSFSMKRLGGVEKKEPTISKHKLEKLSAYPLSAILGATSAMGVVLKPEEFQQIVLTKMGENELASKLYRDNLVFQKVASFTRTDVEFVKEAMEEVLPLLRDSVKDRTAFGEFFSLRSMSSEGPSKNTLPTPTPVKHSLLDKLSAAYNGYRRSLMMKVSQAAEIVQSDPKLREVVLGDGLVNMFSKTASRTPIVSNDSMAYLMGAYFSDRSLLCSTADEIAVSNKDFPVDGNFLA